VGLLDSVVTNVDEEKKEPEGFRLEQNYPNPFNPTTHFGFRIADYGFVLFRIYDSTGREVATLVNEQLPGGKYHREWTASGLASGVYFYRLLTNTFSSTRKLQLLK
ncbi:MAG: T9SS type A sorting domain-containing protein, partial [Bacteroidota bacterium]